MAGRHDKAGDDPSPGLMLNGPIAIRGVSRGVRKVLRLGKGSRHRAAAEQSLSSRLADGANVDEDPNDAAGLVSSDMKATAVEGRAMPDDDHKVDEPDHHLNVTKPQTGADEFNSDLPHRPTVSIRDRRSPEAFGAAVLMLLAVVCLGLIAAVIMKSQNDAAVAAREAARYTPPPLSSAEPTNSRIVLAVIGDETATLDGAGLASKQRWPALLGASLAAETDLGAAAGAGYARAGANGETFVDLAKDVPPDSAVVLFVGGGADAGSARLNVAKAATRAFSEVAVRAPGAAVIAVGPLFDSDGVPSGDLAMLRSALRSSARIADIKWIDPVERAWLASTTSVGEMTAARENIVAARLAAAVEDQRD